MACLSFTIFYHHLPFIIYIYSYLPYLDSQHGMPLSCLGRQFTTVYYQGLEALNQAVTLCCVLTLQHNSTLSTDKPSRMCVLFLQSTPPQNWILLSVYQNRSGSLYQDLCYTCVLAGYFCDNIWYISQHAYTITKP